jgi:pimeloyl-ACP methyl ester carboxylesterase
MWLGWMSLAWAVQTHTVTAASGRTCAVALQVAKVDEPVPLVLSMLGSGLYSRVNSPPLPTLAEHVKQGRAALLVFDKPGVKGANEDGSVDFDAEVFATYTPQDLIDCAEGALSWAIEQPQVKARGHIVQGHSEGAMVAALWSQQHVEGLDRIASVVLSGTPVKGLAAAMAFQGETSVDAQMASIREAANKDLRGFLKEGPGMGPATFDAWMERGSMEDALLALVGARVPLLVQHGTGDASVPVADVTAWMSELQAPWVSVELFDAGHGGSLSSMTSWSVWVEHHLRLDPDTAWMRTFMK